MHRQDARFLVKLNRAFGPVAGGLIIDLVDLATFGPIGLFLGLLVGGLAGWWVSSIYRFSLRGRLLWSFLAGVYCMLPLTAVLPLFTVLSSVARFGPSRDEEPRTP